MGAQIPETMPLSDLLKSTGYDCPEELQDKTFAEATAGDQPAALDDNKNKTINVSTYTTPVEITPSEGKEGMKKATVTLSNIPSGADLEANHAVTVDVSTYTEPIVIEAASGKDGMVKVTLTLTNIPEVQSGEGD